MDREGDARGGRGIQHREEVVDRTVDAAVGEQAHDVEAAAAAFHVRDARLQGLVRRERSVGERLVDHDDALRHDASATDVDVADLAIAHHARGQADVLAARPEERVRIRREDPSPIRQIRGGDRVAARVLAVAPAVEDREHERALACAPAAHRTPAATAASTIARNDAAERLAPPIRPPSICGCAMKPAAFSGFMLPP